MVRTKRLALYSILLAFFLAGFYANLPKALAAATGVEPLEIERFDYYIENIHPSYWAGKPNPEEPRLYITFYVYFKNLEDHIGNIEKVQIFDAFDNPWTIDLKKNTPDSLQFIGGGSSYWDNTLSSMGTVLCINEYRVVVTMKDQETLSKTFTVYEPGQKTGSTKKFIYNEDYRGKKDDSYIAALQWGTINSVTYHNNIFDIRFTISDPRTANAKFEFFDKNKKYLGQSRWLVTSFSKEVLPSLNNGNSLATDGQPNTVQIRPGHLNLEKGKNINRTKYIVLVTKDGEQFSDSKDPDDFYYISYGEPTALQK